MATWEFEDFVFIEHLAIHSKLRGQGIGTKLIQNYLSKTKKEIFLEVEPPTCEMSKKRILFYEKLRFCLNDFYYLQQPLNHNDSPFELKIMSYSKNINEKEFIDKLNTECNGISAKEIPMMPKTLKLSEVLRNNDELSFNRNR